MTKRTRYRSYARGLMAAGSDDNNVEPVSDTGGLFDRGYVLGYALMSVGPALGHGAWVDEVMVATVAEQNKNFQVDRGKLLPSRFTHGSMSGDGIEEQLGKTEFAESETETKARGNLHFHSGAMEEKRQAVIGTARDAPEDFGASIVFYDDFAATVEHALEHGAELTEDGIDWENFQSPDEANSENFPHVRLERLLRADIVGDPAANAEGMFGQRDETFRRAIDLFEFAIGIRNAEEVDLSAFGIEPANVRPFAARFIVQNFERIAEIKRQQFVKEVKRLEGEEPTDDDDATSAEHDEFLADQAAAMALLLEND